MIDEVIRVSMEEGRIMRKGVNTGIKNKNITSGGTISILIHFNCNQFKNVCGEREAKRRVEHEGTDTQC